MQTSLGRGQFIALALLTAAALLPSCVPASSQGGITTAQSVPTDVGCKPGIDDRRSDLCAQWKAADAAEVAAQAARDTYDLTLIGTIAIVVTLLLTLLGNWIALRAVETEHRPYLAITSIICEPLYEIVNQADQAIVMMTATIRNTGSTPATRVMLRYLQADMNDVGRKHWKKGGMAAMIADVPPGDEETASMSLLLSKPIDDTTAYGGGEFTVDLVYYGPNRVRPKHLRQYWSIGSSVFGNAVQPLTLDATEQNRRPVARPYFTYQMT